MSITIAPTTNTLNSLKFQGITNQRPSNDRKKYARFSDKTGKIRGPLFATDEHLKIIQEAILTLRKTLVEEIQEIAPPQKAAYYRKIRKPSDKTAEAQRQLAVIYKRFVTEYSDATKQE